MTLTINNLTIISNTKDWLHQKSVFYLLPSQDYSYRINQRWPIICRGVYRFVDDWPSLYLYKGQFLELEAVLQGCSLVEYEVLRSAVVILEEVSYTLKLNCDT